MNTDKRSGSQTGAASKGEHTAPIMTNDPMAEIASLRKMIEQQDERIDLLHKKMLSLYQAMDRLCERVINIK